MTEQHWHLQRGTLDWQHAVATRWPRFGLLDHSRHVAVVLLAATAVTLLGIVAWLFPAQPALPLASLIGLGIAALMLPLAWCLGSHGSRRQLTLLDAAGVFALVGFGAGMLSDPESIVQLFFGEQPRK